MTPNTFADADTRSPWYEAFAPARWVVASEPQASPEPPAASGTPDEDWAVEAIFDYYND